jgi:toxin HigB-1
VGSNPTLSAILLTIDVLHANYVVDDLVIPAGNRLERLKGDQAGRYSVRVNDQYRATFRWENGHANEVRVEGYHDAARVAEGLVTDGFSRFASSAAIPCSDRVPNPDEAPRLG